MIRLSIVSSVLMLVWTAQPAWANTNKSENIGVGVGAIVGAAAGGPVGFLVGVIGGAKIGEHIDDRTDENATLSATLQAAQSEQRDLTRDVVALQSNLSQAEAAYDELREGPYADLRELMTTGLEVNVLFASDEYQPGEMSRLQLTELAAAITAVPDVTVAIHGYADSTGGKRYNELLSQQRAQAVRDILVAAGVPSQSVQLQSHGSVVNSIGTHDRQARAEDRRVTLEIGLQALSTPSLAEL